MKTLFYEVISLEHNSDSKGFDIVVKYRDFVDKFDLFQPESSYTWLTKDKTTPKLMLREVKAYRATTYFEGRPLKCVEVLLKGEKK